MTRLSGPLLDRLDVHVFVPPVDVRSLSATRPGESSADVRARVIAARARQLERARRGDTGGTTNSTLSLTELERVAPLDARGRSLIERAVRELGLSARAYVRVLRVARTIADLEGIDRVTEAHVAEAIQGRVIDGR